MGLLAWCHDHLMFHAPRREMEQVTEKVERGVFRVEHVAFAVEHAAVFIIGAHLAPFLSLIVLAVICCMLGIWFISHFI